MTLNDWSGTARSNYVRIKDLAALKRALKPFPVRIEKGKEGNNGKFAIFSCSRDGGWPIIFDKKQEQPLEFDPAVLVMPHVKKGEIFIVMEAGHEDRRYISGVAAAYIRHGRKVRHVKISLSDIYRKALEKFKANPSFVEH